MNKSNRNFGLPWQPSLLLIDQNATLIIHASCLRVLNWATVVVHMLALTVDDVAGGGYRRNACTTKCQILVYETKIHFQAKRECVFA